MFQGGSKALEWPRLGGGRTFRGPGGVAIFFSGDFGSQAVFGPSRGHGRIRLEKSVRRDPGRPQTEA